MHDNLNAFTKKYGTVVRDIRTKAEILDLDGNLLKEAVALWDTGATSSCISIQCANELKLKPLRFVPQFTAGGAVTSPVYRIGIQLNDKVKFTAQDVPAAILNGIDLLIGMDIITQGNFSISNYNGQTIFSYIIPSHKDVDFNDDIYRINKAQFKQVGRNDLCPCGSGRKFKDCCMKKYGL